MSQPFDVVYFAGAGGSSEAYRLALGKHPDVALNHNSTALAVHQLNFPETEHMVADVFDVDPRHIRPGVKWRSFWASPDCRHFSKAKGGAPVSPRIRGLAWIVVKVAKLLGDEAPNVIFLENVEEFRDWGPLIEDADGKFKPDPARKGETFALWKSRLEQCGYEVQHRELIAADYGAPTTRKRLFLIARRDGQPIVWPEITHAPRKVAAAKGLKPYVPAADIIDWSLPCPSIFLTQAECKAMGIKAKRPLEEATLQRIAKGTMRYVIGAAEPFIAPLTHRGEGRFYDVNDPLRTVTSAHRGEMALVTPLVVGAAYGDDRPGAGLRAWDARDPLRTVTSSGAGGFRLAAVEMEKATAFHCEACGESFADSFATDAGGLAPAECPRCGEEARIARVGPFITECANGSRRRVNDVEDPLGTVTAYPKGGSFALGSAFLTKFSENSTGHLPDEPLHTVMAGAPRHGLVSASIIGCGSRAGQSPPRGADDPLGTVIGKADRCLASAFLEQANTGMVGREASAPLSTIVGRGTTQRLVSAHLDYAYSSNTRAAAGDPSDTIKAITGQGGHHGLIQHELAPAADLDAKLHAFLIKYYGTADAADIADPLHSVTSRARFGLVIVRGEVWRIVDIGMRMLTPDELKGAQGFGPHYITNRDAFGRHVTKTNETLLIGNSVSPINGAALIAANLPPVQPARAAA